MRARGANALLRALYESTYGTPPGGNYLQFPFVTSALGEEQPLIQSDLLGQGRKSLDPTPDVITNAGDIVVPVDSRAFGYWLALMFGAPSVTGVGFAGGSILFSAQPATSSTITLNGTAFTFVSGSPTGNQIQIGADLSATLDNAVTVLNASSVPGISQATYSKTGPATTLTILNDAAGVGGNSYTLAASSSPNSRGTVSGATLTGGTNKHRFTSDAEELPSMAVETGMPEVPSFEMNFGVRLNTMKIDLSRKGLLNATLGMIAKGSTLAASTNAGTPIIVSPLRFSQATGAIKKDGTQLGHIVSASASYSNNLDLVETIQPDGRIEDADPGTFMANGNITARFADTVLLDLATAGDPMQLSYGWSRGAHSLIFTKPRVFLPRPKRSITGPNGIQASFDWQASGDGTDTMTADLVNDVALYDLP